ncbi:hypothetical protein LF599_07315 [Pseudodesulfovibrio thermohalotolerans]|uniref:hypothetical protein n=1 Tax=Pseudodesulfovibrio thermohalotolerans TaxID=2880651 RepID=UPI0022BA06B0|nr:hypothetical protein [Pseudodesulfovibrio thermohalotolerans]WFS63963.1 hypothetical protein LF599_07315 [Pseudodesulfovibrio thermohalotolerans]
MDNMFIVRDDWKFELHMPEELGGDMGETHYWAVEVFEQSFLFHVYFYFPVQDEIEPGATRRIRMIVGDIGAIIASIKSGCITEASILLQYFEWVSPDGNEGISGLQEVISATDKAGQPAYLYVCKNGMRFVDSLLTRSEEELTLGQVIYSNET